MNVFLDGSNPVEKRLEFLVAAIQLSQDDQEDSLYEGVVLELMVQSYSLLTLIKHCIYDENLPLIFRVS
jgi:hypothetical protein